MRRIYWSPATRPVERDGVARRHRHRRPLYFVRRPYAAVLFSASDTSPSRRSVPTRRRQAADAVHSSWTRSQTATSAQRSLHGVTARSRLVVEYRTRQSELRVRRSCPVHCQQSCALTDCVVTQPSGVSSLANRPPLFRVHSASTLGTATLKSAQCRYRRAADTCVSMKLLYQYSRRRAQWCESQQSQYGGTYE